MTDAIDTTKWSATTERDILIALTLSQGQGVRNNWVKAHELLTEIGYPFSRASLSGRWTKMSKEFTARLPPDSVLTALKAPRKRAKKTGKAVAAFENEEADNVDAKEGVIDDDYFDAASHPAKRTKLDIEPSVIETSVTEPTSEVGEKDDVAEDTTPASDESASPI